MTYLSGIRFDGKSGDTCKVAGYAMSLESGKKYSIKYMKAGDPYGTRNLSTSTLPYVFVSGPGNFNLGASGCHFDYDGDGDYKIILEQVGTNCEDFIDYIDSEVIVVAPPPDDIDITDGENVKITNVQYPAIASKGDELEVTVYFMNVGTENCEIRTQLVDVMTRDVIDRSPDIMYYEALSTGQSMSLKLSTDWNVGAMPDHDWQLRVDVLEINKITNMTQKTHESRTFTIKLDDTGEDDSWYDQIIDVLPDTITDIGETIAETINEVTTPDTSATGTATINVRSVAMAGNVFVSGTAPPDEDVQIVYGESKFGFDMLARDTVIMTTTADADGRYSTDVRLEDFGGIELYARVKKFGAGGVDILARDITSDTETVWVITYSVLMMLGVVIVLIYDKASGGKLAKLVKGGRK